MHVLIDLDGTLVDTNDKKFEDIKFGRVPSFALADIPSASGAEDFVNAIRQRGHLITIVSDSHGTYVAPLAEKRFGASSWLALADKPNTSKLRAYLEREFGYPSHTIPGKCLFVGDTKLDVHLARGLSIPSVMVDLSLDDHSLDPYYNENLERTRRYKEGATYNCRSFDEVIGVLDAPANRRFVLEDPIGTAAARLHTARNANDGLTLIRCLGRQQQGPCDGHGAIARYHKFGSEDRSDEFLQEMARDVSRYLQTEVLSYSDYHWDLVTCVADKATTKPSRKMAKLLHALDDSLPKEEIFEWSPGVTGGIRQQRTRNDRIQYIKRFVSMKNKNDLLGKNVIVIDDQYTTGATAMSHVDMLLDAGACNVLFIALFYITNDVPAERVCPICGKTVRITYRRRDGAPFYNCVPPKFNGGGCGWTGNIDSGLF